MTRLNWNQPGTRLYEAGLDRGVFYPPGGEASAWNGLTSLLERSEGGDLSSFYMDGVKYLNVVSNEDFAGTIEAFNRAPGMRHYDGQNLIGGALIVTQQPRRPFNLSYRTLVGDDTKGTARGYRIHLVYNVTLLPTEVPNTTLSDSPEPLKLSWEFSTVPVFVSENRPSSHFIIDAYALDPDVLEAIEDILYGSADTSPVFPTPEQLVLYVSGPHYRWVGVANNSISEKLTGTKIVRNLPPNPGFETPSGNAVEYRKNFATHPTPVDTNGWHSNLGTSPSSYDATGGRRPGTGAKKFTRSASTPSITIANAGAIGIDVWSVAGRIPVTPGQTWTISANVKANVAFVTRFTVRFYDDADATVGSALVSPSFNGDADAWVRPYNTIAVPAGATNMAINSFAVERASGNTVGTEIAWITDAMYERKGILLPFFNGSAVDAASDPDLTAAWLGTVNKSDSRLTGSAILNVEEESGQLAIQSTRWASNGTKSLRQISVYTNWFSSGTRLAGAIDSLAGLGMTFVPGKTYTVLVKCRLSAAQVGTLYEHARKIEVRYGNGSLTSYWGPQAPNTEGTHELRYTFTLPPDADRCVVLVHNGASIGNGDVYWDDFLIVEGSYQSSWFSGDSLPTYPA